MFYIKKKQKIKTKPLRKLYTLETTAYELHSSVQVPIRTYLATVLIGVDGERQHYLLWNNQ